DRLLLGRFAMFTRKAAILAAIALFAARSGGPCGAQIYNGWHYAIDSPNDGSGGSMYEMRGLAFMFAGNVSTFAVSSGLPLGGNAYGSARNGRINLGDLFLNFSGNNLTTPGAFSHAGVFGIRFDSGNDSLGNLSGSNASTG